MVQPWSYDFGLVSTMISWEQPWNPKPKGQTSNKKVSLWSGKIQVWRLEQEEEKVELVWISVGLGCQAVLFPQLPCLWRFERPEFLKVKQGFILPAESGWEYWSPAWHPKFKTKHILNMKTNAGKQHWESFYTTLVRVFPAHRAWFFILFLKAETAGIQ